MRRFLIDASCVKEGHIALRDPVEINHMKNALRLREGAEAMLSDGVGKEYFARLIRYDDASGVGEGPAAVFEVLYERAATADPETKITLFQCLPKQGKMERIIQQSTELGVSRIVPVLSERSVSRPKDMDAKVSRWRRIAEAASKQAGRGRVPEVADCIGIADVPAAAKGSALIFPYEAEREKSIKSVLQSLAANNDTKGTVLFVSEDTKRTVPFVSLPFVSLPFVSLPFVSLPFVPSAVSLIIGPEGGFAELEAAALVRGGALACSLGRTILRTETAGPAAIAMILYELELDGAKAGTQWQNA